MSNVTRAALLTFGLLLGAALGGCGGGASTINGKVIRGDLSFLVVVDSTDPRLKGEGLSGAQVRINALSERGGSLLGQGKSDAGGNVKISVHDSDALLRPAEFSAELEGYERTSSVMSIPATDKRVLVILRPGPASAPK